MPVVVAGLLEVGWAIGLKYTEGFTRLWPTVGTVTAMVLSVGLLGVAMKSLPVGTAYAVWVGVGAVGTALAPFTYQLTFFAPKGFAFQHADVDGVGAALVAQQQGEIVQLRFALPAAAQGTQVAFHLVFQ